MKYIITERQYNLIEQDQELLRIPFDAFSNDWWILQKYLDRRGNPPYKLVGDISLRYQWEIDTLGSLVEVIGSIDLYDTRINSLGNLKYVSGFLELTDAKIKTLGNLEYVAE
jgi:hypothetical protein